MKQVLQNLRSGLTEVVEVPAPGLRPGSALIQTAASLVSAGTERMLVSFASKSLLGKMRARPDLVRQVIDKARREGPLTTVEAAFNRLDQPMPLGYSAAGTVLAAADDLAGFPPGTRVACAGGGFAVHAEQIVVPRNLLAMIPDGVSFDEAAFATLGAISLHGFRLSGVSLGERVAVIGLGLLGQLAVQIARAAGCSVLGIDLNPGRVDLARRLGAEMAVVNAEAEEAAGVFSQGRGVDTVLICADTPSDEPVILAGAIARPQSRVIAIGAVGQNLPRKVYYEKELTFLNSRSYGPGRYDPLYEEGGVDYPFGYVRWTEGRNLQAVLDLIASRRLDVKALISHRFPIDEAPAAYDLITGKSGESFLGVLLTYTGKTAELPRNGSAPAITPAEPRSKAFTPPAQVQLGVLGAGNFATAVLLPALKRMPEIKLSRIASASGVSARHAARRYGFEQVSPGEDELIADAAVNTVAVLTRHHLHARQALAALRAGKHVFVEKPLALTGEELDELAAALTSSSPAPLLTAGFNRRFAPLAVQLKAFLDGRHEPLVAHYRVNAGYLPLTHWLHDPAQGGGRLIGEGCHFIDFLTFLIGSAPVSVEAQSLPEGGRYREDNLLLTYCFADGSLGSLHYLANGDKSFPKERVEVFCGGRAAALDDFRSLEMVQNGRRQTVHSRLRQDKGHAAIWQAFTRAILAGGPPPIPYAELFGVSRAAIASLQAVRQSTAQTITGGA